MKHSLQLKLGQHLTMTPQLQQAIRLLQLSSLELHTEIQQALDSNMMLELPDETDDTPAGEVADSAAGEVEENVADPQESDLNMEHEAMPDDLPVDSAWDDVFDALPVSSAAAPDDGDYEVQGSTSLSLRDHLLWQLEMTPFTETDRVIALAIIDDIDPDGYFQGDLAEIAAAVGADPAVEEDEVLAVLHRVQDFDPPGVGARDLRECLQIQLRQAATDEPVHKLASLLVDRYLDLLASRDFDQLMRRMRISKESLQEVIAYIQALNPRPGSSVESAEPEYVIPDVFVVKRNGGWHVGLNPDAMPKLRINPYYASLVRRADDSADNATMKSHLQEARWFLKSLQSRSDTLLRVARAIVEKQTNFLEFGEEAMRPMVLHDIAEMVDMHESTISRVTTRKYMHTPRGIYELKYFFSSHVSTDSGGEASSTAIRALIKKLVDAESPSKPLSDSKIASILSNEGINVARRTIAKYREAMTIPSSTERKRLA